MIQVVSTMSELGEDYAEALHAYELSCEELYRSELALHDAHQTGVDAWITAAADRLHRCLVRQLGAEAALAGFRAA